MGRPFARSDDPPSVTGERVGPEEGLVALSAVRPCHLHPHGESMEKTVAADGTTHWRTRLPDLMEVSHPTYPGWDLTISDQVRADLWISDLKGYTSSGRMPELQFLWLPNDHTAGTRPGQPTP